MRVALLAPGDLAWSSALTRLPHDVYHLPAYAELVAREERGRAAALHMRHKDFELLVPLVLRALPDEVGGGDWFDAVSPYGYAGPISSGELGDEDVCAGRAAVVELASARRIVSAFLRLHPVIESFGRLADLLGPMVEQGDVVVGDLTRPIDEIERGFRSVLRNNIRQLERDGFKAERNDFGQWGGFVEAYLATMRRIGSVPYYQFSATYFAELMGLRGRGLDLVTVKAPNGTLAAGAAFFSAGHGMNYHLSGTADSYLEAAPTKLALREAIRLGVERGAHWLNLGGGVGSVRDGLFAFKARFFHGTRKFRTLRAVLAPDRYAELCVKAGVSADVAPGFFPAYRRPRSSR